MRPHFSCGRVALFLALAASLAGCASRAGWQYAGTPPVERREANVLTAADLDRYPLGWTVEQILVQAISGLTMMRGDQGPYIVIRAANAGRNVGALVVVDGVPLPENNATIGLGPNEVGRVEVLKDAASTALYGFRGAGGVILVETRGRTGT